MQVRRRAPADLARGAAHAEGRRVPLRAVAVSGGGVRLQAPADPGGGAAAPSSRSGAAARTPPWRGRSRTQTRHGSTRRAALLAHHYEEAGEAGAAARWHRRAAEWVGLNDIKAALQHWQRVRELARHGGDEPESTALTIVACSQALTHGWRLGASATEWAELFEEGCAAAERAGDLAALAMLNATYAAVVRGNNQAIAQRRRTLRWRGGTDRRPHRRRGAPLRDAWQSVYLRMLGVDSCGKRSASPTRSSNWRAKILTSGAHVTGFSPLLAAR